MAEITPKGSEAYKTAILDLLKDFAGNPVGWVILGDIIRLSKKLVILPFSEFKGKGARTCRAVTRPDDWSGAAPKGIGGKKIGIREKWYLGRQDDPDTDENDERYDTAGSDKVAAGGGSDAEVYFTPGEWGGKSGCFGGARGALPDEVLFHEMVHALRDMQGLSNPIPTTGRNASYHNEEEFLAIVVTNIYMSARGSTQLIADHFSHATLWPPLNTSKGFVDDAGNRTLLDHHRYAWKPTFDELAKLKVPAFNPFRELNNRPQPP